MHMAPVTDLTPDGSFPTDLSLLPPLLTPVMGPGGMATPPKTTRQTLRYDASGDPLHCTLEPPGTTIEGESNIHGNLVARYYVSSHGCVTHDAMDFSDLQYIMDELYENDINIDLLIRYQVRGAVGSSVPVTQWTPSDSTQVAMASTVTPAILQTDYFDYLSFRLISDPFKRRKTNRGAAIKADVEVSFHVPQGSMDPRYSDNKVICYQTDQLNETTIPGLTYSYENTEFSTGIRELGVYSFGSDSRDRDLLPIDITPYIYLHPGKFPEDDTPSGTVSSAHPIRYTNADSSPSYVSKGGVVHRKIIREGTSKVLDVPETYIKPIMYPGPTELPENGSEGDIMELLGQLILGTPKDESWIQGVHTGHYKEFPEEKAVKEICKGGEPTTIIIKASHCLNLDFNNIGANPASTYTDHTIWYGYFKHHLLHSANKDIVELENSLSKMGIDESARELYSQRLIVMKGEVDKLLQDIREEGIAAGQGPPEREMGTPGK